MRLEIYDEEKSSREPSRGFSEVFLGSVNYRKIRRGNMEYGNTSLHSET